MNSEYRPPFLVALASATAAGLLGWSSPVSMPVAAVAVLFLIALAFLSPVGAFASVVVTLPYFYRPIETDTLQLAASEILLLSTAVGAGLRIVIDVVKLNNRSVRATEMVRVLAHNRLVQFLTALTVIGAVSVLVAYDAPARGASLREWRWSLAEPLLLLGMLVVLARTDAARRIMAASLICAGVLAAAHGLLDIVASGGIVADSVRRLSGPFPHPNALALFMLRPFVLSLALVALLPRSRVALALSAMLTGIVLLGTFSRGAMLAAGVAVTILALDAPRRLRWAIGSIAITATIVATAVASERMSNLLEGGSVSLRIDIWSATLEMIRDRPVTGFGPDQFFYVYAPRYIHPTAWDERFTSHAHNLIADSWIRLGILGAAAAIIALITVAARLLKDHSGVTTRSALARAATLALGATLVHGLIDNAYFGHDLAMSAWLLAWLAFDRPRLSTGNVMTDV